MGLVDRLGADTLRAIAPGVTGHKVQFQRQITDAVGPHLPGALRASGITTPLRIAHFLAQIAHESDSFSTTEEYASGAAYEGRADLGNAEAGDGRRYKGRGLIQLTGRANYRAVGGRLGLDLIDRPELAADPEISLRIGVDFWTARSLSPWADQDDLVTITRRINGGSNGLASRRAFLGRAKAAIAALEAVRLPTGGTPKTVYRGSSDEVAVALLQECLRLAGWRVAIDGEFGPATELAVRQFQAANGLFVDGIVGARTWGMLLVHPDDTAEALRR